MATSIRLAFTPACILAAASTSLAQVPCELAWAPGWGPTGLGANGVVRCMLVHDPDAAGPLPPRLYVGGDFTTIGGITANHVAYFDGTQWFPLLGPGGATENGTSGTVRALTLRTTGIWHIVVGGQFATAGSATVNNIAEWDGTFWSGFGSGTSGNTGVNALIMFDGKLWAGGSFTAAGGAAANFISRFDFSTNTWSWPGGASNGTSGGVNCFAVFGGKLHVGGAFPTAGLSTDARFIATWVDGLGWRGIGGGVSSTVDALLVHDSKLILAGNFTSTGTFPGAAANRIASWNGTAYAPLSTGFNGRVRSLADFDEDGACSNAPLLYAGGDFSFAGTTQVNSIARWDGTAWTSLGPAGPFAGSLSSVFAMAQRDDACGPALAVNANVGASLSTASNIGFWAGKDTDQDGILDCWESMGGGIDGNCDGIPDLDLYADKGCRPNHKDILVEVDAMLPGPAGGSIAPTQATLDGVAAKFAVVSNTFVHNPDGTDGYHLVAELDEPDLPFQSWLGLEWAGFDAYKTGSGGTGPFFGTATERASPAKIAAKRKVYRYCIFANDFTATKNSGLGELGGNDFFITLGNWRNKGGTIEQQQATFMHELGHTLGLYHGGGQEDLVGHNWERFNYKPNYHSVMNYLWQFRARAGEEAFQDKWAMSWRLDYSSATLPMLDEKSLVESAGLGGDSTMFVPVRFPTIPTGPFAHPTFVAVVPEDGGINWNVDTDVSDTVVVPGGADVNLIRGASVPSPGDELEGFNDWANLKPCFCHTPDAVDGVHTGNSAPEIDAATAEELEHLFAPPCPCVADFDHSGGTPDVGDIDAFFIAWLSGDASADADCSGGTPDTGDIDTFFTQWLSGGC